MKSPILLLTSLFGFSGSFGSVAMPTFDIAPPSDFAPVRSKTPFRAPRPWLRNSGYYEGRHHRSQVERSNRRKAARKA